MTDNVTRLPPRNAKQALIANLRDFIDQAERDQITSVAVVICRPTETPADPPTSYYRWRQSLALVGASAQLTKMMLEDAGDDTPDRWNEAP